MNRLEWSDALALDLPQMDDTHREFVALLAAVQDAHDVQLAGAWRALIEHTESHFGQEDRWMQDTRFASGNCHATQHLVVLKVMREGDEAAQAGRLDVIRLMAHELAAWFPQHAQSMDAALALHLRRVGYDVATGAVTMPQALPVEEIRGCAGASCSTPAERPAHALA
ncbi:MAG: hemerythrin domain-containing protein [Burkholderiaceae bacterium]